MIKQIKREVLKLRNRKLMIISLLSLFTFMTIGTVNAASNKNFIQSAQDFIKNSFLFNSSELDNEKATQNSDGDFYVYDFDFTGNVQHFTAPLDGEYQLETWGAQGGHRVLEYQGGRGGYTKGTVKLKQGERIAIYVGGYGLAPSNGYNGGGANYTRNVFGGGATDIRVGNYSTLERIIVAGGGGSVGAVDEEGAAAGGEIGFTSEGFFGSGGDGATQTRAGLYGAFGRGGSAARPVNGTHGIGGGGGGGWYGGGGVLSERMPFDDSKGGGGGSSYALRETSYKPTDYAAHSRYNLSDIEIIDGNSYMPAPNGTFQTGNPKNGYARITKMDLSENNLLQEIEIKDNYLLSPEFDPNTNTYSVTLPVNVTEISIKGHPQDPLATVEGNGVYEVKAPGITINLDVVAENGAKNTYKVNVKRMASTNPYPHDVEITGLIPSLCDIKDEYCNITPEFDVYSTMEVGKGMYTIIVPARIKQVELSVIKAHLFQTVIYPDNNAKDTYVVDLQPGENAVFTTVMAEDGMNSATYLFNIIRDMEGNAELDKLDLVDPERDLKFDPDITEYFTSIPFEYDHTDKLLIEYETLDPNATAEIDYTGPLSLGTNILNINVTAENGNTKRYVMYLYREENGNSFLKSLRLFTDIEEYKLNPSFNKMKFDYHVIVENDVKSINVEAFPEVDSTIVSIDSETVDLDVGQNSIKVTSTARTGTVSVYNVIVVRKPSSNNNIVSISINGESVTDFNPSELHQTIEVDSQIMKPYFQVKLEDETARYTLGGDHKIFKVGENTVHFRVTAEDNTVKTYTVVFIKGESTDSSLKDIYTSSIDISKEFDSSVFEYNYDVDYTEEPLYVMGIATHKTSKIEGNGDYYLNEGENEISLFVIAEDNSTSEYIINVNMENRPPNTNPYLKTIGMSSGELYPKFESEKGNYQVHVNNDVESIDISTTPIEQTTTVSGDGPHDLVVGDNLIEIVSTAENGNEFTYEINVVRDVSINADLMYLYVHEGALDRKYFPEVTQYNLRVPFRTTKLEIETETVDPNATYEIIGNENLKPGMNEVIIRVTPDNDGPLKDYVLNVFVQGPSNYSLDLSELSVNRGTLTPEFVIGNQFYRVTVENEITDIQVHAIARSKDVELSGTGNYSLEVGENVVVVRTTSPEGITKDFQIVVERKKSSDTQLVSLGLTNLIGPPYGQVYTFRPTVFRYTVTTMRTNLGITPVTRHPKATFEIIGNHDFNKENITNTVVILVTAEDGITKQEYTLDVKKIDYIPSDDDRLSSLSISGAQYEPQFSSGRFTYEAIVPNDLNQVKIDATARDPQATLEYNKMHKLEMGNNFINVKVISESKRRRRDYTVKIFKEGSKINNLVSLSADGVPFEDFNPDHLYYDLDDVEFEKDTVYIDYELEDDRAKVTGAGEVKLKVGANRLPITVTSENGEVKTYYIDVKRNEINSSLIEHLYVDQYPFDGGFESSKLEYDLIIDNEVNELNLSDLKLLDPKAQYEIVGNENLTVGVNKVYINVISSKKDKSSTYTLNIIKQSYGDNLLEYLRVEAGNQILDLKPEFKDGVMVYKVDLSHEFDELEIFAKAKNPAATIDNLGTHQIEYGMTQIKVPVTSPEGPIRTYHVFVERSKSHDNFLTSLDVILNHEKLKYIPKKATYKTDNDPFDPNINDYRLVLDIPVGTEQLTINATANASNVVGTGVRKLEVGTNELEIVVTSDSGIENIYTIEYNRIASDVVDLNSLRPSSGDLNPNFDSAITEYGLDLSTNINTLSFAAAPKDKNATVSGHQHDLINTGETVRTIRVTAENGVDFKDYIVNVNKPDDDNAYLKSLKIGNYRISPNFEPNKFDYSITVPNKVEYIDGRDIEAIPLDETGGAYVSIPGRTNLSTLSDATISIVVTAGDGLSKQTYRVKVVREKSDEARLKNLIFNTTSITPGFSANRFEYTLYVPYNIETFSHKDIRRIETIDPNSTFEYSTLEEIQVSEEFLQEFKIIVTSQDKTVTNEYIFNIGRRKSSDNLLSNILIDDAIIRGSFSPGKFKYDVDIQEDTTFIVVQAFTRDPKAEIISITGDKDFNETSTVVEILVEAENGNRQTYELTIHRTLSYEFELEDLTLTNVGDDIKLSPEYDPEINNYEATLDRHTGTNGNVGLIAKLGHPSQKVRLLNEAGVVQNMNNFAVPVGENTFILEVYNGYDEIREIEIELNRVEDDNNLLRNIELVNQDKLNTIFNFEKEEFYYTGIEIPFEADSLEMLIEKDSNYSKFVVYNNENLSSGNNLITIRVTAENGDVQDYILRVFKEYEVNNLLQTITVSINGTIISNHPDRPDLPDIFSPQFHKATFDYVAKVSSGSEVVSLEGVIDEPGTKVTVIPDPDVKLSDKDVQPKDGIIILPKVGSNRIRFITEKSGQQRTYTVNVVREAEGDVNLKSLQVYDSAQDGKEQKLNEPFDPDLTQYTMDIGPRVNKLFVSAIPNNTNARVVIEGEKAMYTGENLVKITVTSEDRLYTKVYFIKINKSLSDDNDLLRLRVTPETRNDAGQIISGTPREFVGNPVDSTINMTVDSNVSTVQVNGELSDPLANIIGFGRHSLNYGTNEVKVHITSQNDDEKTYTINIFRKYDNSLESLKTSTGTLIQSNTEDKKPGFDPKVFSYEVWVPVNTKAINLHAVAKNAPTAVVEGDGLHDLEIGDNYIRITVESPEDTTIPRPSQVTTVKVIRSDSVNANLRILDLDEGMLTPEFDPNVYEYTTAIRDTHKEVNFYVLPEDTQATFEILEIDGIVAGDVTIEQEDLDFGEGIVVQIPKVNIKNIVEHGINKVTIRVKAASGFTQDTIVHINRQPVSLFSNLLSSLTVTPSTNMVPAFNPILNNYLVTVTPDVEEVDIQATTQVPDATIISGTGFHPVVSFMNTYNVVVRSKDGIDNVYGIKIFQQPSSDPYLKELEFEEGYLSPVFASQQFEYRMNVPANTKFLNETYVKNKLDTEVVITGAGYTENIVDGDNNFVYINTTAADGINKAEYKIRVNRTSQTSIYLKDIETSLGEFTEEFVKTNEGPYTLELESTDNSVMIYPKPEEPDAVDHITVDGVVMEGSGFFVDMTTLNTKNIEIIVHGVAGNQMKYFINIKKELGDAVKLNYLAVNPGTLDPLFDPNVADYVVNVDSEVDKIEIIGSYSGNVTVTGLGLKDLNPGENTFHVVLTTDTGEVGTYTIVVNRKINNSARIMSLRFKEALIENPGFDKDHLEYELIVPYEVEEITIDNIVLEDPDNATYEMNHIPDKFNVGSNNFVEIEVTNKVSSEKLVYKFRVTRHPFATNFLASLVTDQGPLDPLFDKNINNYDITVPFEVDKIKLDGAAEDQNASVVGLAIHDLEVGTNQLKVVVTVNNLSRTYIVRVNRLEDSRNSLINLEVKNGILQETFNPEVFEYNIEVPAEFGSIEFIGEVPLSASVVGLDNLIQETTETQKGNKILPITAPTMVHEIVVTAKDGTSVKTYKFNITKTLSSIVSVDDIVPTVKGKPMADEGFNLDPEFNETISNYRLEVPDSTSHLGFDVITSPLNTVIGNEEKQLSYGENEFEIKVTSEDGTTSKTYIIVVTRLKDIQQIKITPDTIVMAVNEIKDLFNSDDVEIEIIPEDATSKSLNWTSDDEEVVSVDENGVLTAHKEGNVVIKTSSKTNENINAVINVEVLLLQLESDILDIRRFDESIEGSGLTDDLLGISDYVIGAVDRTTLQEFKDLFKNKDSTMKMYDLDGNEIEDLDKFIASRMIIKLVVNDKVYDELRVAVRGDLDGDGHVIGNDAVILEGILIGQREPDQLMNLVSDLDKDGSVIGNDLVILESYLLGIRDSIN